MADLVHDIIIRNCNAYVEDEAIVIDGVPTTYGDLSESIDRAAAVLCTMEIEIGDRVGLYGRLTSELLAFFIACLRVGAVTVSTHHTCNRDRLLLQLTRSGSTHLITDAELEEDYIRSNSQVRSIFLLGQVSTAPIISTPIGMRYAEPLDCLLPELIPSSPTCIFYTTGSTKNPKGVVVNHEIMLSAFQEVSSYLTIDDESVIMSYSTLASDYGVYNILMPLLAGGTAVVERSEPQSPEDIVSVIAEFGVTALHVFPPIIFTLSRGDYVPDADQISSLTYVSSSGQPLRARHIDTMLSRYPGVALYSNYGMTECKRIAYIPPQRLKSKPLSVGKPLPSVTAIIVDGEGMPVSAGVIGELWVHAAYIMLEYWADEPLTNACIVRDVFGFDRMLRTGDLFYRDEDEDLFYVARIDDIFVRNGWNVNPRDIEQCLSQHPAVGEVLVMPVADEQYGLVPKAVVVPASGESLNVDELVAFCQQHLEWHMVPAQIELASSLPRSPSGKSAAAGLSLQW